MKYVSFATWGHSGHTLVAAILDAHPNIAISNTYRRNITLEQFKELAAKPRYQARKGAPYDYQIPGQGEWKELKVIGYTLVDEESFLNPFDLPRRYITTVREPRDVVSCIWRKRVNRVKSDDHVRDAIEIYEARLKQITNLSFTFALYHEDWTANPFPTLKVLCWYLDVPYIQAWAERSVKIIAPVPPRHFAPYQEHHLDHLRYIINEYALLSRYRHPGKEVGEVLDEARSPTTVLP